ncbi:MAG: tetratricopeptide repeat protein [Anaerolineae bacterium]|nr:tetratricopeptide repeat protein [Anaerolineae bacterium]
MQTKLSIFCSKIVEAGWLAAIVTVPLFFNIYSARTFEPDKITMLRAIVSVMILAWLVMVVEQGFGTTEDDSTSFSDRFLAWLKLPLVLPTLVLVIIYIISTILSISPQVSLWGSYQRLQGTYSMLSYIVVFALMAGQIRTQEQVDRLVNLVIITSVPIGLYGIIQRYGLDPLPWAGDVTRRVAANMGNAIFVASYLIMTVPLTITRLIRSMIAIIKDEETSWGHTILAAVYIFALAIQIITILFSQSRGPMLGIMGASFVMGLLLLLIPRQYAADTGRLSLKEIALAIGFILPLGVASGLTAGLGYAISLGLQRLLMAFNYQIEGISLAGVALGALLGFFGSYTYMISTQKGWRWLWLNWLSISVLAISFVLALNIRGTTFDPFLEPIRELPYFSRLAQVTETSSTGRVRILIWEAALELVKPHQPLGIDDDAFAQKDSVNSLRPLIGYGPESMFNAFAFVYPPELAHVEVRGSSADRSHNETMDSLVITGILGFLAFYFMIISLLYYAVRWLGWIPNKAAQYRLIAFLIVGGIIGAVIPYIIEGQFTFMPLGLPFGVITGLIIYLAWQGIVMHGFAGSQLSTYNLLTIALLGAIIGHFIEVHFVFSIAATYIYFWAYAGLLLAIGRIESVESTADNDLVVAAEAEVVETVSEPVSKSKRSRKGRTRRRKTATASTSDASPSFSTRPESWKMWVGSQGLAMAIILIILAFDFITPQFEFSLSNEKSASLFWMVIITWLVGFAIVLAGLATRSDTLRSQLNWVWAVVLYSATSLLYFLIYTIIHGWQFGRRVTVNSIEDVLRASGILANGLVVFYVFLFLLMGVIAVFLMWGRTRGLPSWRSENWWLYPPLVLAMLTVIWFKNIDVVRADIFLKEGERYRSNRQWSEAIALHEKAISLDSDEDFYYLMLALDYQLMAQDSRLDADQRNLAWGSGENTALTAREINPYNPDNTGNMGRYYFTLAQISADKQRRDNYFNDAISYFEKSTELAPSNVIYHNLWAQTYYILASENNDAKSYDAAIDRLQTSISIDPNYSPTWLLMGDTYAAMGDVDQALHAHSQALKYNSRGSGDGFAGFADQFFDQRLNFYISAGRGSDIIAALQQVALERLDDPDVYWAIGHAYNKNDNSEKAIEYFERALALGDTSADTLRELANIYLGQSAFEQASPLYEQLIQINPGDVEAHSALAFMYAQQGQLDKAIEHNQMVLQQMPNDYDSLKNLAILYKQQGQLQQAFDVAQQAQAAAPENEQPSWEQFIADLESQIAESS